MLYQIQPRIDFTDMICIHKDLGDSLQLQENQEITLFFGKRTAKVCVKVGPLQNPEIICISQNIIDYLLLDSQFKYEIAFRNNEWIIGPVIGLLLGKREENLEKNLTKYLVYMICYEYINGLLFVYCEEQIDFTNEQITGFIYDPSSPTCWRKAQVPFPSASFRRVELSARSLNLLIEKMGRSFFNSRYFDKWLFWQWVFPDMELREYLPETTNKVDLESLNFLLEKYGGVFLKPRNGSRGKGIHFIKKEKDEYVWAANYEEEIKYFTENEIISILRNYKYYLLQQPIILQTYENRKVDYRVLLQKDHTGIWQCTGIIARFGKAEAISSNFKANGYAMEGFQALKTQFGYDDLRAYQKFEEMVHICIGMASKVEEKGAYADFGIDVGIDEEERIWVIEMNKRPDHDFPLLINNRKMYYFVKTNPVLYAKYLAMGGA